MPNRILKESICTSYKIDELSWFEEVLFYRLIVSCDDFGRFDGRTAVIKSRLFPLKNDLTLGTVKSAIRKLVSAGLVTTYESMGKPYLYLPTWNAHQTPRAKKSKYPSPDSGAERPDMHMKPSENICNQMISDESNGKQIQADAPVFDIRESYSRNDIRETVTGTARAHARDPAVAAVMSAYLDKINPYLSERGRDELAGFVEVMGPDVCLRAIDEAMDNKAAKWPYIRKILSTKQSQGVRCLADWDALEKARHKPSACQTGGSWKELAAEMDREDGV